MTRALGAKQRSTGAAIAVLIGLVLSSWIAPPVARAQGTAPNTYVGSEVCQACHPVPTATFSETLHGKLFEHEPRNTLESRGCEACHGPGSAHAASNGEEALEVAFGGGSPQPPSEQNAVCLQCHEKTARLYWEGGPHESRDLRCTNCHTLMRKVSEERQLAQVNEVETCGQCHTQRRAQSRRSNHMPLREGQMKCTNCHNPHGSANPKLLKEASVNEVCYTCHAEKRGPFLWEHAPVVESCLNCHDPHGTNHEKLLKVAKPRLCQQCHIEVFHPTQPQTPESRFVFNRSCTNCHSQIHGSNHPSGLRWHR